MNGQRKFIGVLRKPAGLIFQTPPVLELRRQVIRNSDPALKVLSRGRVCDIKAVHIQDADQPIGMNNYISRVHVPNYAITVVDDVHQMGQIHGDAQRFGPVVIVEELAGGFIVI